jgi:hypothetical protein
LALCIARERAAPVSRRTPSAWPLWVEAALVATATAALLPWFDRVAIDDVGRDRRFADAAIAVRGLADPVLPSLCASHGARVEPLVRERLCHSIDNESAAADFGRMPAALADARVRTRSAFLAPLNQAQARLSELRLQQREGLGDLLSLDNAIEAAEREVQPFVKRYDLDGPDGAGPLPLACAFESVDRALAQSTARAANVERDAARANAVLLLGAAFDGHPATGTLADAAMLPVVSIPSRGPCAAIGLTEGLTRGAALIADARHAPAIATKNEAMRGLLHSAGWQWAAWMLVGFGMLQLSRRSLEPA